VDPGVVFKVICPDIVEILKPLEMDCEDKKVQKKSSVIIAA
jgi:hypothetical protein